MAASFLGAFDCLPLIFHSPFMAQWEFSAFKSFLLNSKTLWVLDSPGLNLRVCEGLEALGWEMLPPSPQAPSRGNSSP